MYKRQSYLFDDNTNELVTRNQQRLRQRNHSTRASVWRKITLTAKDSGGLLVTSLSVIILSQIEPKFNVKCMKVSYSSVTVILHNGLPVCVLTAELSM